MRPYEARLAQRRSPAPAVAPAPAEPAPSQPTGFTVDAEQRRVYLPGDGWMGAAAFRDIYLNQPERLPPDLDPAVLHVLEPHTTAADAREAPP
jgi:hypothetical protein